MSKDRVRQQFGANAAAYATSKVHSQGASLGRLVEVVKPQPHWQALDIASAAGHTAFAFAPHVTHVVSSDLTPEMRSVAGALARERGIDNVSYETADAEHLPFADAAFDLVTCRIAPHHFADVRGFLSQSARVLRPGGILAVVDNVVPGGDSASPAGRTQIEAGTYVNDFERLRDPSHHRALSLDEWLTVFSDAGFDLLHSEVVDKEMEFQPWAERMGATPEVINQLFGLLVDAPPAVLDYFRPRHQEESTYFFLREALIVGRKLD